MPGLDDVPQAAGYAYFFTAAHCLQQGGLDLVGLSLYDPKTGRRLQVSLADTCRITAPGQQGSYTPDLVLLAVRREALGGIRLVGGLELAPDAALQKGDAAWLAGYPASLSDGQPPKLLGTPLDVAAHDATGDTPISGAPFELGMSGGPVVDVRSRVRGVLTRDYVGDPTAGFCRSACSGLCYSHDCGAESGTAKTNVSGSVVLQKVASLLRANYSFTLDAEFRQL